MDFAQEVLQELWEQNPAVIDLRDWRNPTYNVK